MSLALHYWMGDVHTSLLRAPVSEMTYTVSSGTLSSVYHTIPHVVCYEAALLSVELVYCQRRSHILPVLIHHTVTDLFRVNSLGNPHNVDA